MPNGEAERSLDVDAAIDEEVATPPSQARSVKPKAPKKRDREKGGDQDDRYGPVLQAHASEALEAPGRWQCPRQAGQQRDVRVAKDG